MVLSERLIWLGGWTKVFAKRDVAVNCSAFLQLA